MIVLALFVLADHIGGVEGQHDAGGDHHSRFLLIYVGMIARMVGFQMCIIHNG